MDSKATMVEEELLESAGKLVHGSWLDRREGLVREMFGRLGCAPRLASDVLAKRTKKSSKGLPTEP